MKPIVAQMIPDDWKSVRRIYEEGIATGQASFDTEVPDWDAWDTRHLAACRLVARVDGEIAGWAALSPVSSRCVHSGVAEVSLYVGSGFRGRGVGKSLMAELVHASGARRNLDPSGRSVPGERCKHRASKGMWLPGGRQAGTPGKIERSLEGRAPDGTTE